MAAAGVARMSNSPLIIGFVADLMFAVKIENVARQLGYDVVWVEDEKVFGAEAEVPATPVPGERLFGRAGKMMDQVVRWQPALMIFDLANPNIPWQAWIANLKSSPATRRLPILCYAPHVDTAAAQKAKAAGAEVVVARSRFAATLPALMREHTRTVDTAAIMAACQETLAATAQKGIDLFNRGEYFDAHEELEHAWMADKGPGRDLYRAVLQIAVCYLQIERLNYRGAMKMLLRVRQWLAPLPEACRGVNVARLREDVNVVYEALRQLGPDKIASFDWALIRPVVVSTPPEGAD